MIRKFPLALLLLLFIFQLSFSQRLHFQQYSISEGIPHASIYSIIQDTRGFIWLGTGGGGLARSDGFSTDIFSTDNGLSGNFIRALHEDKNGNLWIGTDNGLDLFDGISISKFPIRSILDSAMILVINETPEGDIIIGTGYHGLVHISMGEDTLINTISETEGLISPTVMDILPVDNDHYWLSMVGGINIVQLDEGDIQITRLLEGLHIPGKVVTCSERGPDGNIWFGTRNRGIFFFADDATGNPSRALIPNELQFLQGETIWDIEWTDSVTCWIATERRGAIRYRNNQVDKIIDHDKGLPTNQIYRLLADREKGLWLATLGNGAFRYSGDSFIQYDLNERRQGTEVYDLVEITPKMILVATDEGIYRLIGDDPTRLEVTKENLGSVIQDSLITSIAGSIDGALWIGTHHGLFQYDGAKVTISEFNELITSQKINCLYCDSESRLWIGTDNGYNVWDGKELNFLNQDMGLINNEIQTIIEDTDHHIWVGTLGGLVRVTDHYTDYNEADGLMDLQVQSLAENENGEIWVGTFGGGLYVIDPSSEPVKIKRVGNNELLSSSNIYSLKFVNGNTLIAANEAGFDQLTIENDTIQKVVNFDEDDGFSEGSNNLNSALKDSRGLIWFGTSRGLISYDHRKIDRAHIQPEVYLTSLRLFFEDQEWTEDFQLKKWSNLPNDLKLIFNQNHLTFDYKAILFDDPKDLKIRYYLEGLNKSWSPFSFDRSVTFQGLPPGNYKLRLQAQSKFGLIGPETTFEFKIQPPFWMTGWFLVLAVVFIILLVYLMIRLRIRKLKKDKQHLEETVKLRTWELKLQKEQIEEQRDLLESQQKEITDSLQYANHIQNAIFPEEEILNKYFKDFFIILKPLHIVSGDFYWIGQKEDFLIVAAADCTGHGVPGSLMSMLGISFLNKIIIERGIVMPSKILDALRDNFIRVFHDDGESYRSAKDGMDIALFTYNIQNKKLYFAGAMNPLFQIRSAGPKYRLMIHQPDMMPVSKHSKIEPFSQIEIELKEGDALYMFSDGFSDQFGGELGKKFMKKRFKQMLLDHQDASMAEQREIYLQILKEWMSNHSQQQVYRQIDDILLMGIKV